MNEKEKLAKTKEQYINVYLAIIGFAIIAATLSSAITSINIQAQTQYVYTPLTRTEVCINLTNSNEIYLITNLPYNSSLNQSQYGWMSIQQSENWSKNVTFNRYPLSHNFIKC